MFIPATPAQRQEIVVWLSRAGYADLSDLPSTYGITERLLAGDISTRQADELVACLRDALENGEPWSPTPTEPISRGYISFHL